MGGAVKSVVQAYTSVVAAPYKAYYETGKSLSRGESVGTALGTNLKTQMKPHVEIAKDTMGGIMGKPDEVAAPEAPKQESLAERQAREEAARRKAKTELAKDKPGRQGTILSDESAFPYRLV